MLQQKDIDRAIRNLSRGRDREASSRLLYETYCRRLRGYFARRGFSPEDCRDLTQETFFRIYESMETYHHEGRFEGWLFTVASTTSLKNRRAATAAKRSGHEISHEDAGDTMVELASPADQERNLLREERRQIVQRAVRKLPKQMRMCMTLHLKHRRSYREIAVIMKLEINTVKAHMFQGRKKLQKMLSADVLGELDD